jgi:hypothetical protein
MKGVVWLFYWWEPGQRGPGFNRRSGSMTSRLLVASILALGVAPAMAQQDPSYRKDIEPMMKKYCYECHAAPDAPSYAEFKLDEEKWKKAKVGPRLDTYEHVVVLVAYPGTGAFMRRLDDGTHEFAGGKPGNMLKYLGETDAERKALLGVLKAWVGEGGWNLNRMSARGNVPALTKEQLDKLKVKY